MMRSELEYVLVGRQVDKIAVGKAPSDDGISLSEKEGNSEALGYYMIVFFMHKRRFKSQLFSDGRKRKLCWFCKRRRTNPLTRTVKYIELF